jgi:hypothetical protein
MVSIIRLPDYEHHRAMQAADDRRYERGIAHRRGLWEQRFATGARREGWSGWQRGLAAMALWVRRARVAHPVPRADGPPTHTQLLTDAICRLADGSRGRIAIVRESDDEWSAVCVRVD